MLQPRAGVANADTNRLRRDSPPAVRCGANAKIWRKMQFGSLSHHTEGLAYSYLVATVLNNNISLRATLLCRISTAAALWTYVGLAAGEASPWDKEKRPWSTPTILPLLPRRYDVDSSTGWQEVARVALSHTAVSHLCQIVPAATHTCCWSTYCCCVRWEVLWTHGHPASCRARPVNMDDGLEDTMSIGPLVGERLLVARGCSRWYLNHHIVFIYKG